MDARPSSPLSLRKGRGITFRDEAEHRAAWETNAELYALSVIGAGVSPSQRARVLYIILGSSWSPLSDQARKTVARVARFLLAALPVSDVLMIFLALRRARVNHKHVARAIVRYLTEHPRAFELAVSRRRSIRDALEHALGRRVASAIAATAATAQSDAAKVPFARNQGRAHALIAFVFGRVTPSAALQTDVAIANAEDFFSDEAYFAALGEHSNAPKTVNATNRGDISATLVHMYRGGATEALSSALTRYVERAAGRLPSLGADTKVAVILDASASMRGYGEREFCSIAQSVALSLVLERVCSKFLLFRVGGSSETSAGSSIPFPSGSSDLASALIDAASCKPDVIAILTDGYENQHAGDLVDVARALPRAMDGIEIPIVVCQSKFTFKDDLALRRIPTLHEVGFWHEEDFSEVLLALASRMSPAKASTFMRQALDARLNGLEKEVPPWTSAP